MIKNIITRLKALYYAFIYIRLLIKVFKKCNVKLKKVKKIDGKIILIADYINPDITHYNNDMNKLKIIINSWNALNCANTYIDIKVIND